MLVKKELLTINHTVPVQIVELPKSGSVLAVKLKNIGGKSCAFYSDGVNYIYRYDGEWTKRQIIEYFYSHRESYLDKAINEDETLRTLCRDFLHNTDNWSDKVTDSIAHFTYKLNSDKRWDARVRKAELQRNHLNMFPALPDDFIQWCEAELMQGKYLFFSNKAKGERKVYCTACQSTYEESAEIHHEAEGVCKHCGTHAIYHAERYHHTIKEEHLATVCSRSGNTLLIETREVLRKFDDELKPKYYISGLENILVFPEEKKHKIYRYCLRNIYGTYDWYRYIDELSRYNGKLYDRNLQRVFPAHYIKDVERVAQGYAGEINTTNLLINLTLIPQTEYLLKMGMTKLAAQAEKIKFRNGRGFSDVMGVPPHYKDIYKRLNISISEHEMICRMKGIITESQLVTMRKYGLTAPYLVEGMMEKYDSSLDKILNYLKKQMISIGHKDMNETARYWIDYLDMAENERVLTKDTKFPPNLKLEHDRLTDMINERKDRERAEKLEREAKEAAERLERFEKMAERCQTKKYIIQIPKVADDLVREGQALHHCVGNGTYWARHARGTSLICFIRKKQEPDTPYFTMEINTANDEYTIAQIQSSYNTKKPDAELERFAQRFLNMIQPKTAKATA